MFEVQGGQIKVLLWSRVCGVPDSLKCNSLQHILGAFTFEVYAQCIPACTTAASSLEFLNRAVGFGPFEVSHDEGVYTRIIRVELRSRVMHARNESLVKRGVVEAVVISSGQVT